MKALLERLLLAFWENEVEYLKQHKADLENQKAWLVKEIAESEARLRRAEIRQLQYARLA